MWRPSEISARTHRLAEPVARLVAKTGVTPNALTILGFLLIIGVAWVLSQGYFLLGGFLMVIASSFDFIDGALARVTGRSTRFGALLDSSLDRYSEAVLLFGLLWFYAWQPATQQEVLLIFATIVGSLLVSYVRARAEGLGLDAEVGIMRRTVRILILALGLVINQVPIILWILAILTNLTAVQRLFYVWRRTRKEPPLKPE
ncbi:MAG: CDP-alcohol phosphatidyltransferase family protein [Dehalococcoidia bacterium]|nr:CDP-alcohol phosphatidyltransferase family protein [Dehalococcoidia bacterium]